MDTGEAWERPVANHELIVAWLKSNLRAGVHHGLVCIGCCWMLMVALVAVGVMNVAVMVGIALLIAFEKRWRFGEQLAKVAGDRGGYSFAALIVFKTTGLSPACTTPATRRT